MKNLLVYAVIGLGVVAYNVSTQADRDDTGAIVSEGNVDAFTIRLGDCFNSTSSLATDESGEVSSLPGVPCSAPHDYEVYAVFDVNDPSFPGDEAMSEIAFERCLAQFEGFVGRDYETSSLDITSLYPTKESWDIHDDREVICALTDVEANKLTGSAKDTAI
jgi:hypothetical protein